MSSPRLQSLTRLFSNGERLTAADAQGALSAPVLNSLIEASLLLQDAEGVRALFQVQIYNRLVFFADFKPPQHPADLVLPIGPSGRYLARATIRGPIQHALDLGCGCGIQALLMAQHAQHVTASDINPRALALTRLNASLNGFSNIEVLEGSYFEPVRGRTFDLITANLPYVLNPDNAYIYRDLSSGGDAVIRQTVEQVPLYLNEGGYAQLMLNWVHQAQEPWWQPVENWTKRRNVDAWLLHSNSRTPEAYARTWIIDEEAQQPAVYEQTRQRWLKWYAAQGIQRIAFGMLTLRRRTGRDNWRCSLHVRTHTDEPLGGYIQQLFQNQDYLSGIHDPDDLLDRILSAGNVKIESASTEIHMARTTRGFLIQKQIHLLTGAVIGYLDGHTILREAIQKSARTQKPGMDSRQKEVAKDIHQLMNLGMLAGASDPSDRK